jgi:hypothetical protein
MGYYILHHPELQRWTAEAWNQLVTDRHGMKPVKDMAPQEALSDIWFYAGVFHDFAYLVEKSAEVQSFHQEILPKFGDLRSTSVTLQDYFAEDIGSRIDGFLRREFDNPSKEATQPDSPSVAALKEVCLESLAARKPDHGVLSAMYFRRLEPDDKKQGCLMAEAARAMALHNAVSKADPVAVRDLLSWRNEPLACLLLLCDQLQTWDRERHDETNRHDLPSRAELSKLEVALVDGKPEITIAIDYVAPAHLERSKDIFDRVKDELDHILAEHPKAVLEKLSDDWPFRLNVTCTMSGTEMNTRMALPISHQR